MPLSNIHASPPRRAGPPLLLYAILCASIIGCTAPRNASRSDGMTGPAQLAALASDGGYDYSTLLVNGAGANLEEILRSLVKLESFTEFETEGGLVHRTEGKATGIVIFDRFVLTVDHAVSNYRLQARIAERVVAIPARVKQQDTFLVVNGTPHPLEALVRDRENDIALFRLPDSLHLPNFPYPLGNSDDLRIGNFIYVVGNPMNMGFNVREGIVSNLRAPDEIQAINAVAANAFMVSNGLNPGDSGTPAVAIRDGRFELVGLTQGTFLRGQRLGWVIRINAIMDRLRAHLGGLQTARRGSSPAAGKTPAPPAEVAVGPGLIPTRHGDHLQP